MLLRGIESWAALIYHQRCKTSMSSRWFKEILLITNLTHFFQCIYFFTFSTCFEQPIAYHQENRILSIHHLVNVTLCRWLRGMPVRKELQEFLPDRHTRQSPTQSDIHQMMYWYISILLMTSTGVLETCRERK